MSASAFSLFRHAASSVHAVLAHGSHAFSRHSHEQYGIGLIWRGAQRSWSGRGRVEAQAGDLIMVNPSEMHDGSPLGEAGRSWGMLYFEAPTIARTMETLRAGADGPLPLLPPVERDPELARALQHLLTLLPQADSAALEVEEAEAALLARWLPTYAGVPRSAPGLGHTAAAREWLDEMPAENTRLATLAALCGLTPFQLLRAFQCEHGVTPHAYQTQRRLLLAQQALRRGAAPANVALDCGFADQSHLTRAFKRQTGLTPAQYARAWHG